MIPALTLPSQMCDSGKSGSIAQARRNNSRAVWCPSFVSLWKCHIPCRTRSHAVMLPVWGGDCEVGYAPEDLRLNRPDDPLGYFILDREYIRHLDVVAIGPDVMIIAHVDQLR